MKWVTQPLRIFFRESPEVVPRTILGATFVTMSLSREKVLVTANPHPASKARRTIGQEVVGGAEAKPNGFGNLKVKSHGSNP